MAEPREFFLYSLLRHSLKQNKKLNLFTGFRLGGTEFFFLVSYFRQLFTGAGAPMQIFQRLIFIKIVFS